MKLLLDENLSTFNQSSAATLKILLDNKDAITESLEIHGLASVEIMP